MYTNLSSVAALIGEPKRLAILMALADGKALTAGELAYIGKITPQTASSHLAKLVEGGLLQAERQGRHRYYRITGREVVNAIEAIARISPPVQIRSLRESEQVKALKNARTCYGHIAGKLGVALSKALVDKSYFLQDATGNYRLTALGVQMLRRLGVHYPLEADTVHPCHIDWTERRHHLGGPLAVAITDRLVELEWIKRGHVHRSMQITEDGTEGFLREFGVQAADLGLA